MTDKDLVQAWAKILYGMTDGVAASAVAVLVLTEVSVRRGGEGWDEKLFLGLRRFHRLHLEFAVKAVTPWMGKDQINRMNKDQLIDRLITREQQQQAAIAKATK